MNEPLPADQVEKLTPVQALEEAVRRVNTQAELAAKLRDAGWPKVQQAHISNWINKTEGAPPKYVPAIERVTGVPKYVLCPSVFERAEGEAAA